MRSRFITFVFWAYVLSGSAAAGDMTRGLTITGGQNALARLKLERVRDPSGESGVLKLHGLLSQAKNLKGYGFSLRYDAEKYAFVEALELDGNLLTSGSGQQTLFLWSNRTPGVLNVSAVKVDGQGASGSGRLFEMVFRTSVAPSSADFEVTESVLVGLDGAVDVLTHAEIGELHALPERFVLERNQPNPFNPATVIGYHLPAAGLVRLAIYNLLGQEVRVLVNEPMNAGSYTARWDGTDERGRQVASGVYLYRLQAGSFTSSRRMLLLK